MTVKGIQTNNIHAVMGEIPETDSIVRENVGGLQFVTAPILKIWINSYIFNFNLINKVYK